jgi:hypothetical protein
MNTQAFTERGLGGVGICEHSFELVPTKLPQLILSQQFSPKRNY